MNDLSKREIAEREVATLNLDALVRAAARGGDFDGTANYEREISTENGLLRVRCTAGAGTNSASVRLGGDLVYENSDYGRYLRAYRRGEWVETIQDLARRQVDVEATNQMLRTVSTQQQENDAFTPLGD